MKTNFNMKQVRSCLLFGLLLTILVLLPNNEVNAEAKKEGNITWQVVEDVLYISPVPGTNGVINDYNFFDEQPWKYEEIKKVVVNPGVTVIGEYAFDGMNNLTRVELPNSVTTIKYNAFSSCSRLEYVNIPEKVTYIDDDAFAYVCEDGVSLVVDFQGTTLPKMGNNVFYCIGLYETAVFQVQNPNVKVQLDNYIDEYADITVKVTGITSIQNTIIGGITNQVYTGKAITQNVIIMQGSYRLINNKDYEVSYLNNTNMGTATVIIQGIGVFTGENKKTFNINGVINRKTASIYVGKTVQLSVGGTKETLKWTTSDSKIATVDSNGKVLAKKKGTATIVATLGNNKVTCKVDVKNPTLSKTRTSIYVGKSETIKVLNGTGIVSYKTSNKKIATVDKNGRIVAKAKGTVTITAAVLGVQLTCTVTVKNPTLSKATLTLYVGNSETIKVKNCTGKVSYQTSNKKIATVSKNGKIVAKAKGTVTITATVFGVRLPCKVKVENPIISKTNLSIYVGDKETIKIKGVDRKLTWKTSNSKIATVNSSGKITAKKKGTVTISTTYKGKTYKCKVTVKEKPPIVFKEVGWNINSADGVEPYIEFKNNSNKVIKYVDFETVYYNPFAEPAYCEIRQSNKRTLAVTGPIKAGAVYTAYWDAVLYNSTVSRMDIDKIIITYVDGSKKTVKSNKYWVDSDYYGK